jgi:hypothetical protein
LLLTLVLLFISCSTSSNISRNQKTEEVTAKQKHQVLFRNSTLLFDLPSDKWSLVDEREMNDKSLHAYVRESIQDKVGRNVMSTFAIICEGVSSNQDLTAYSIMKRNNSRFHVNKIFTHEDGFIKIKHALGYVGTYTDSHGVDHTITVVHAINNNVGYQMSIDATSEIYPAVEKEFYFILDRLAFTDRE